MPASSQSTPADDGDLRGLERVVERCQVERDLNDGMFGGERHAAAIMGSDGDRGDLAIGVPAGENGSGPLGEPAGPDGCRAMDTDRTLAGAALPA